MEREIEIKKLREELTICTDGYNASSSDIEALGDGSNTSWFYAMCRAKGNLSRALEAAKDDSDLVFCPGCGVEIGSYGGVNYHYC